MENQTELTDAQCDAILDALNWWARDIDPYEYGLPMYGRDEEARKIIRDAIADARQSL